MNAKLPSVHRRISHTALASLTCLLVSSAARAQVDVRALFRAHSAAVELPPAFRVPGTSLLKQGLLQADETPYPTLTARVKETNREIQDAFFGDAE